MGLFFDFVKKSETATKMMELVAATDVHAEYDLGKDLYQQAVDQYKVKLVIYPSFFFDPDWCIADRDHERSMEFFMQKWENSTFYTNIFAYHYHNRWDTKPEVGSAYDLYDKYITKLFDQRFANFTNNIPK